MTRCPSCGATGGLSLTALLVAKPAGSYSLSGAQDKTAAVEVARLSCGACAWWATGRIEGLQVAGDGTITGGHLVIDQPDNAMSADLAATGQQRATSRHEKQRPRRYWSAAIGRHVTIPDNQDEDEPR